MDALRFSPKSVTGLVVSMFVSVEVVCAGTLYVDASGVAGYPTIAAAVSASRSGDTIVLLPGVYQGAGNTDVHLEGTVLTVRGSDPNDPAVVASTVVDCSATKATYTRAFTIDGTLAPTQVTITGLTLTKGARAYDGGAVLCLQANLTLVNCTILNNTVTGWGGAVYLSDGQATLTGCTFRNNSADALFGGALCAKNSIVDIANCAFESNSGSAIQTFESSLTVNRSSFTDNTGDKGGAIYSYVSRASIPQTYAILRDCTFVRNKAATTGGALYVENVSTTVTRCTFTADTAGSDGGAICHSWCSALVSDSVFIGNSAVGSGGAVFNGNQSSPEFTNCTFVANVAASGGAATVKTNSEALFRQCILWNNAATQGKNLYVARYTVGFVYTSKMTVQYSDVQGGQSSALVDPDCTLAWGAGNINVDPLFIGPFQNDYHLSPDSPCIDAGDPTFVPAPGETDLDGNPRVLGGRVDLGAFEYLGMGPVYRFWSEALGLHFYTISGSERDKLVNKYSNVWRLEGIAFYAYFHKTETNLTPVYRFWSAQSGDHLYTISESEKTKLTTQLSKEWKYEGIVFYVYPARKQPFGAVPVYRFVGTESGNHFYTASETEKAKLLQQTRWIYEGVAWYAFAQPNRLIPTADYEFTGGTKAASYTMTLAAYIDGVKADIDQPLVEFVPQRTEARMSIDFIDLEVTLDELHVQTETVHDTTKITQPGLSMEMTWSAKAGFDGLSRRGPFAIEPTTNLFANFLDNPKIENGNLETFSCAGSVTVGGRVINFNYAASAVQFELSGAGVFESLVSLPEGLYARMPLTFQWHRPFVKDLLAETSVNGHLVQLYVTNMYVGTLDLWEGHIIQ